MIVTFDVRQMEVERALLEGEHESEVAQLQREKELLDQLKEKIHSIEKAKATKKSEVKKKKKRQVSSENAFHQQVYDCLHIYFF